jgi:hypothetical protein
MGSDTTPNGIKFQFTDRFKPIAKRQLAMRAAGLDPKDVNLDSVKGKGSQGQSFESFRIALLPPALFLDNVPPLGHLIDEFHSYQQLLR